MLLKKISIVAAVAALSFGVASASELSFFGGMQGTKDIGANNKSENAPSYELMFKSAPQKDGFASNVKLKYQDNKTMSFWDFEALVGWQFGDTNEYGAFKILPLGVGYRYMEFDRFVTLYGNGIYDGYDSLYSFYYKFGVEYQKDKFLLDNLSLNLGAYYQTTFYSETWETASGNSYEIIYKPSGYELEAGLDYNFTENFAVGAKVGYSKIDDKFFIDTGDKLFINDGFNASLGIKYKF